MELLARAGTECNSPYVYYACSAIGYIGCCMNDPCNGGCTLPAPGAPTIRFSTMFPQSTLKTITVTMSTSRHLMTTIPTTVTAAPGQAKGTLDADLTAALATSTPSEPAATAAMTSDAQSSPDSTGRLSNGAIIGIAVALSVVAGALITFHLLVFGPRCRTCKDRKKKRKPMDSENILGSGDPVAGNDQLDPVLIPAGRSTDPPSSPQITSRPTAKLTPSRHSAPSHHH